MDNVKHFYDKQLYSILDFLDQERLNDKNRAKDLQLVN